MTNGPFFTVGIPTYNRAHYLPAAIDCVLSQSFCDFELIVSDNHSSDDTEEIVKRVSDLRIRYFRQPENLGPIPNFNYVLEQARGEFLIYLQDDDRLLPDMLKHCHEAVADRPDVVFYGAPYWAGNDIVGYEARLMPFSIETLSTEAVQVVDGIDFAVSCLHSYPFLPPAVAFRTSTLRKIGGLDAQVWGGDIVTEARMMCEGDCAWDSRIGAVARKNTSGASASFRKADRRKAYTRTIDRIIALLEERGVDWEQRLARQLQRMPRRRIRRQIRSWNRAKAPARLLDLAWSALAAQQDGSRLRLWGRVVQKLEPLAALRFAVKRSRQR